MPPKALAVVLACLLIAGLAGAKECRVEPLAARALNESGQVETRDPDNLCRAGVTNYYWTVADWMSGDETYMVYCDPADCQTCENGWKPISVTMYLFWEQENTCALSVTASVERVERADPDCPRPGATVCVSNPATVGPFSPAGLWAVTIPFPEHVESLTEPFFAAIHFEGGCDELPALVTDGGPCEECSALNNWGDGWHSPCDHGFPGNVTIYATIECLGSTPVDAISWGTIKANYR